MPEDVFDPIAVLQALDRHRVTYIVIGALGRVIHGSGELTDGIDIVPSTREENLRRLSLALNDLNAREPDGTPPVLDRDPPGHPVLALHTDAGQLKVVHTPAGTRGYDDLRRAATREPLGHGVRPAVASLGDQARMLAAIDQQPAVASLRIVRRLIELEHGVSRGHGIDL
jgi:hypothetical protein